MALSCRIVSGPRNETVLLGGQMAEWVAANDGTVTWPEHTSLRLVGGPVIASPCVEVPPAAPGQTVVLQLEAMIPTQEGDVIEAFYAFVTPDGYPFGDLLTMRVEGKKQENQTTAFHLSPPSRREKEVVPAPPPPVCAVLLGPADAAPNGLEGLQGELKNVEWTLANVGGVDWPEDAVAQLFYNTPGFAHLPTSVALPAAKAGQTVQVGISVLLPEIEGRFKAMWAVTSPTAPDFGDILFVEFAVSEFPFMEWMLAEAATADSVSSASGDCEKTEPEELRLSAAYAMNNHFVPDGVDVSFADAPPLAANEVIESLGTVSNLTAGNCWNMELALTNDGNCQWPADTKLVCCFGNGFGCQSVALGGVDASTTAVVNMEFTAHEGPAVAAWALVGSSGRFGPILALEVK